MVVSYHEQEKEITVTQQLLNKLQCNSKKQKPIMQLCSGKCWQRQNTAIAKCYKIHRWSLQIQCSISTMIFFSRIVKSIDNSNLIVAIAKIQCSKINITQYVWLQKPNMSIKGLEFKVGSKLYKVGKPSKQNISIYKRGMEKQPTFYNNRYLDCWIHMLK